MEAAAARGRMCSSCADLAPVQAPGWLQYPVSAQAPSIVRAAVRMVWGRGWIEAAASFFTMMKHVVKA